MKVLQDPHTGFASLDVDVKGVFGEVEHEGGRSCYATRECKDLRMVLKERLFEGGEGCGQILMECSLRPKVLESNLPS